MMSISRRLAGGLLCLAIGSLAIVIGCTQGDNPVDPVVRATGVASTQTLTFPVLANNPWNDPSGRVLSVAYASDTSLDVPQQPFPVLYLLHDYGGDGKYFERYNIQNVLEDLYRKGEIGRMMVVTVDASNIFGGSYYRNSPASGQYAQLVNDVITHVERTFRVFSQGGRASRGISGHGMGGYGAMRFAIDHPDLFGSVSSMSGPLSLGGSDGRSGVLKWADAVFAENDVVVGDSSDFSAISPSLGRRFTNQLVAMAVAFSPHPLEVLVSAASTDSCIYCKLAPLPCYDPSEYRYCKPCSLFTADVAGPTTLLFMTLGKKRFCIEDTTFANPAPVGVDLPFDWNKTRADSVWARWLSQDIKSSFTRDPRVFDSTAVYFDCGVDDDERELGYVSQNRDFDAAMGSVPHEFKEYSGFGGVPAGHSQFIQERLREIIKFHDKNFRRAPGPRP
jgi:S-formylglutathione hydrolase FrmB